MSADDLRQNDDAPRASEGAEVSRLPGSTNARVDGIDARAAGLAAFIADEVQVPAAAVPSQGGATNVRTPAQLLHATRARDARRRRARRTVGAALGACAATAFVVWAATGRFSPTLSYTVDGVAPLPDGYVRSSAGHQPDLAFSDGTNIRVMPSTRVRVLDVGRRGARLMLEDGRAHVHVAHRPGADWQVQAGAFVIHVHGTEFFVAWNAAQSRLDLTMESGVVSVDGPRSGDTVTVRDRQSLSLRLDGARVVSAGPASRSSDPSGASPLPVPGEAPPSSDASGSPEGSRPEEQPVPGALKSSAPWSERLADGEAAGILAAAQRRGIAIVLARASSEDLAALADAARFRKQDPLARRALLAQRRRFPRTVRAEEASFLLGRLADGSGGRAADALGWYDRYLHEAPSGAYAAEAMGRKMLVLKRQRRTHEAQAVAAEYLRRFPQSTYAPAARAVASPDGE